ncbi:MAG: hypothetical protein WKH64_01730 [Chloroflexia bacterium]
MAATSNQIEAEIAETRARMSADLDRAAAASTTQDGSGGITVTIRQQMRGDRS